MSRKLGVVLFVLSAALAACGDASDNVSLSTDVTIRGERVTVYVAPQLATSNETALRIVESLGEFYLESLWLDAKANDGDSITVYVVDKPDTRETQSVYRGPVTFKGGNRCATSCSLMGCASSCP